MKYVITDQGEVATGVTNHATLAAALRGKVVAAGHYRLVDGGRHVEVFGMSHAFHIQAMPADAHVIARHLGLYAAPG